MKGNLSSSGLCASRWGQKSENLHPIRNGKPAETQSDEGESERQQVRVNDKRSKQPVRCSQSNDDLSFYLTGDWLTCVKSVGWRKRWQPIEGMKGGKRKKTKFVLFQMGFHSGLICSFRFHWYRTALGVANFCVLLAFFRFLSGFVYKGN